MGEGKELQPMGIKRMRRQYEPVPVERRNIPDFTLLANRRKIEDLYAAADYSSPDPSDRAILDESMVMLFKERFEIDIKTCTERDWSERMLLIGIGLLPKSSQISVHVPASKVTTTTSMVR